MTSITIQLDNPKGIAILQYDPYYGEGWYISAINIPRAHRGKGLGTQLLDAFLKEADEYNKTVWLEIQSSDGLSYDELEAWYLRHGFKGFMIYKRRPKPQP